MVGTKVIDLLSGDSGRVGGIARPHIVGVEERFHAGYGPFKPGLGSSQWYHITGCRQHGVAIPRYCMEISLRKVL